MADENKTVVKVDADLRDLIPGFLENRRKDVEKIMTAVDCNDLDSVKSIGHSLKGVGGGYGFHAISDLGKEIETAAKNASIEDIKNYTLKLQQHLEQITVEFE